MCVGDIHNVNEAVQAFDPHYFLAVNPRLGKYQVMENRTRKMEEGVFNGLPLFSFQDVCEVVMTVEYIDAETEAPDMRIVNDLRMKDAWNYPGGPKAFYEQLMRDSEKRKQTRERHFSSDIRDAAEERHKYIVRQYEGAPDLKTIY